MFLNDCLLTISVFSSIQYTKSQATGQIGVWIVANQNAGFFDHKYDWKQLINILDFFAER